MCINDLKRIFLLDFSCSLILFTLIEHKTLITAVAFYQEQSHLCLSDVFTEIAGLMPLLSFQRVFFSLEYHFYTVP